jgi:cytochrome d ubiquinol oxidase subunit I
VITEVQPMKMAAAEALYSTTTGAPFSLFTYAHSGASKAAISIDIPHLLSFLGTGNFNGTVRGIDDLQAQYVQQFGPGNYVPWIPVAFWSFRLMIGAGMLAALIALVYLWTTRRGRDAHPLLLRVLPLIPLLPAAANSIGWIFTETARQPWIAFGISTVADGISPGLTSGEVLVSLAGFTLVYGLLAVLWLRLIRFISRQPLAPAASSPSPSPVPATVY